MTENSTGQTDKFTWMPGDELRYFHPVTGEPMSAKKWQRIVAQRAGRLKGKERRRAL